MSLQIPTRDELFNTCATVIENLINGIDARNRFSDVFKKLKMWVEGLYGLYFNLKYVSKQIFVSTASGLEDNNAPYLDIHGNEFALPRKPAVGSAGIAFIENSVADTVIPTDSEMTSTDGLIFKTSQQYQIATGKTTIYVNVESVSTGSATNKAINTILTIQSPTTGLASTAKITTALTGGADIESDASYRTRILNRKQKPPAGGNNNDFATWAKEVPGIGFGKAINGANRRGLGTVDVVVMAEDGELPNVEQVPLATAPAFAGQQSDFTSDTIHGTVWSYIDVRRPLGWDSGEGLHVYAPKIREINIDVQAEALSGFEFDNIAGQRTIGNGSTVNRIIMTDTSNLYAGQNVIINGELKVIQTVTANQYIDLASNLSTAPLQNYICFGTLTVKTGSTVNNIIVNTIYCDLANIQVGMKVVINGEEREVISVDSGTDSFVLDDDLSISPTPGDVIYPGGLLFDTIYEKIQIYFKGNDAEINPLYPLEPFIRSRCQDLIDDGVGIFQANISDPGGNVNAVDQYFNDTPVDAIEVIRLGVLTVLPIGKV